MESPYVNLILNLINQKMTSEKVKEQYINEMLNKFCFDWDLSFLSMVEIAELMKDKIKNK